VGTTPGFNGDYYKALKSVKAKTIIMTGPLDLYNPVEARPCGRGRWKVSFRTWARRPDKMMARSASTPARAVALTLRLNQTRFRPGETLQVGLSARNPGPAVVADFYFGVILPDGITAAFVTSLSPLDVIVRRLDADPRTFPPTSPQDLIPGGLDVSLEAFLSYQFSAEEFDGTALVFALLMPAGALAEGQFDPEKILALDVQAFTLTP
jgi:hypothetical protein